MSSLTSQQSVEVYQEYGNDLVINSNGDLMTVTGIELTRQSIIRRLLTTPISVSPNPDYIDEPTYGAGLGQFIGQLNTPETYSKIKGLITSQMFLEQNVSQVPPPVIELRGLPNQLDGKITYTDLIFNQQVVIPFNIPTPGST